ncbi:MAG TPA: tRNA (adenosine(37)-N6)-threonylcarbamoyltransferase complex ATPase subunit type 1 TsaE [Ruminococcaceae bacterium]|nr:tRNA (adenosine(37)-N6)-threonylcarbamoyltransferase complex ATPase subunit type 1 TsaE [Oscillospiraceae bacterium]
MRKRGRLKKRPFLRYFFEKPFSKGKKCGILSEVVRKGEFRVTVYTHSVAETEALAEKTASLIHAGDCLAFEGGLGAGKTAFVRGLAKGLGLRGDVCSPTFSLVNEYRSDKLNLYHFDMYRIETADDLYSTGYFDYLDTDCVLAIEWSENITAYLPENTVFVKIRRIDDQTREITITGDERFEDSGD